MAVNLSPYGGVGAQFLDNAGNVLTGGKIFTYAGGTTTPQATYTTSAGNIPHPNPIILDAAGRVPGGEIWLTDGLVYKFILRDANDVLIATYDGITGINSNFVAFTNQQEIQTATAGQTVFNLTTITYQPGGNNLTVFVDGVNQYGPGAQYAYLETDSDTVTFVNGLHVGAEVKFTTSQLNTSGSTNTAGQISFTGFKGQAGTVQDLADDDGSDWIGFEQAGTNAVARSAQDKMREWVSVKDFGATGDGVTSDQNAINLAITYINGISGTNPVSLLFPAGKYVVTGGANLATTGVLQGLDVITRDNVTVIAFGAELIVQASFFWRRTQIGGGDQDQFARGIIVDGAGFKMYGGVLNGNLRNRVINRGPSPDGYGGNEFGLRINGSGARVYDVIVKEWGTDCAHITKSDFQAVNCEFIGARRLSCAVVVTENADEDKPVRFENCLFAEAATYSDSEYNRPASGIDIEANSSGLKAVVQCVSCVFRDNRKYAVQISQSAYRNVYSNCDFYQNTKIWSIGSSEVDFQGFNSQPTDLGGHFVFSNVFHKQSYLETIYGTSSSEGWYVTNNLFEESPQILEMRTSTDFPVDWRIVNNTAPAADELGTLRGTGHYAYNNTFIDPTQYSVDTNLAIGETKSYDLTTLLPCENATYQVIAKINNGAGAYSGYGSYILTFVGGVLEGSLTLAEVASSGRSVVRTGAILDFTSTGVTSSAGFIVNYIGVGNFGT
jgi:hypothetical protein